MKNNIDISIVIPVWNEEENINPLYLRLTNVLMDLDKSYEIIFVDDGSTDKTFEFLKELNEKDNRVKIIRFTRNFGQHPAMIAGFNHTKGDITITLDGDLQNPPEEIPKLVNKLNEGYDVVFSWKESRKDPLLRKIISFVSNRIMSKITGVKLKDYGSNLRAYNCRTIELLKKCREKTLMIGPLVSWLGVSIAEVKVKHNSRTAGKTKYNLLNMFRMYYDLITGYTTLPIQIVSILGIIISFVGLITGVFLILWRLIYGSGPMGMTSFLALIFILFGVQLLSMGLIGEYVARIFRETQGRPQYIEKEVVGFD